MGRWLRPEAKALAFISLTLTRTLTLTLILTLTLPLTLTLTLDPDPDPKPSPNPNPKRKPKQEVNGKPVYEKDPSTMPMVWASNGYWYVGKRDELGKQAGWMQVRP